MNRKPTLTLQRLLFRLPKKFRRIKVAQWLGLKVMHTPRHQLDFGDGTLVGDIRDHGLANSLVRKSFADYGYFKLAGNLLAEGSVHLDVGANFGFHTFGLFSTPELRKLWYLMVETNPECCTCLNFSRALHPEVRTHLFSCAVGRDESKLLLSFRMGETGHGSVSAPSNEKPSADAVRVTEVSCRRLDDLLREAGVGKIRLMKMDIEGSEVDALEGARHYLTEGLIEYIYFEINSAALRERQASIPQLLQVLTASGYQLLWPHDDLNWLRTVCGRAFDRREEKFARLPGPDGLFATVFDPARHILTANSQLDLLAVHSSQQLEIRPGG